MTTKHQKQRVTLFINHLIVTHAKTHALMEKATLASLVEKALIAYLPTEIIIKKPSI